MHDRGAARRLSGELLLVRLLLPVALPSFLRIALSLSCCNMNEDREIVRHFSTLVEDLEPSLTLYKPFHIIP